MPIFKKDNNVKLLNNINLLLIFYSIISIIIIFSLRLFYPYQLEWMEGGEIEHIVRILEGKNIYSQPTLEFIPYIYTPLFYYIGVVFVKIFGINFFSTRLISVLSFLLILILTYWVAHRYTKDRFWSLVSVGLLCLSYSTTGFWFDLARVDTLANLFMLLSFFFITYEKSKQSLLSSLFAFCAFYTKQSFFAIHIFLLLGLLIQNRRLFFQHFFLYFTLILLSTIFETIKSDGWYIFWNFTLPATHHWIWSRILTFWTVDILPFYSIALALIISFVLSERRKIFEDTNIYLFLFLFGTVFSSYLLRLHYGGYLNVLIPLVISVSIVFPIISFKFQQNLNNKSGDLLFGTLLLLQFALLIYDFRTPIPTEKDRKDIEYLLSSFSKVDGEVYLMGYNYIQRYIGKKSFPHYVLVNDLLTSNSKEKENFKDELINALKSKKFSAIVLDNDLSLDYLDEYYYKSEKFFFHRVFNTKENSVRKEVVWLPKQ